MLLDQILLHLQLDQKHKIWSKFVYGSLALITKTTPRCVLSSPIFLVPTLSHEGLSFRCNGIWSCDHQNKKIAYAFNYFGLNIFWSSNQIFLSTFLIKQYSIKRVFVVFFCW
jgi:hypothetical protein